MRVSFQWLKDYVDIRMAPAALAEKLTMAGLEVTSLTGQGQDTVMEIEITPNRTDCLSMIGIAREAAAITGKRLKIPRITAFRGQAQANVPIQIQDKKLCLRYCARVIKNVRVAPAPHWLVRRLELAGVRSVNNIVDISNFCLLELGQPLHAFDLDKLQGAKVMVRRAQENEQIVTIDGMKRTLQPSMLVIADKVAPQALAGIMGASSSEVSQDTTNILLESASFEPLNIHNTSRRLGLITQSSYRFERGVDLQGVHLASLRATELMQKLAHPPQRKAKGVVIGKLLDKGARQPEPNRVCLDFAQVRRVLGVEVGPAQIKDILRRLGLTIIRRGQQDMLVSVPSFRPDISREADLIEEIVRLYGYEKIPQRLSQLTPNLYNTESPQLPSGKILDTVRRILAALGLHEIMSYSLISRAVLRKLEFPLDQAISVKNPLSYEQEILRPTLFAGLANAIVTNLNRNNNNLRLFELSRIYLSSAANQIEERTSLCIGIAGRKSNNWLRKKGEHSFFELKGIAETLLKKLGIDAVRFLDHQFNLFIPGRSATIVIEGQNYGYLGEIRKEVLARFDIPSPVYAAQLAVDKLIGKTVVLKKQYVPLAKFPSVTRDISLIVPAQVSSAQIVSLINKLGSRLISKVVLFEQYSGEQIPPGFRGLAYSLEYRSPEQTLTAQEVDGVHQQILRALKEDLAIQIR